MNRFDQYPRVGEYDVVVVGGGTAGFAAAASAARRGARTLLLEEKAYLGGTATGAQIGQLMGFADGEAAAPQKGILADVLSGLQAENGTDGIVSIYLCGRKDLEIQVIPYVPETLMRVIHRIVRAAGVEVLLHTRVIGVDTENGSISAVAFHNEQGIQRVRGKVVIDASFHGSVAADAGCRWQAGDENGVLQPGTLMYQMADVNQAAYAACTQPQRKEIALQGIAEGKLFVNNLLARPLPDTMTYCNMGRISVNPLDTRQWSEAEMDSREQIKGISDYFTAHVPGFEKAHLSSTGDFTGLRDSRRILGSYVLKNQDVLEGTEFPDAIARSSYPIDIHDANGVDSIIKKPKTGVFSIPYRAMVTNEISNLILAGRCISTEYEAHACVRVMITCMRMGEAAGLAAAESIRQGVQANKLNGESLKQQLLG